MKKQIIAILMASVMVMSVTACGASNDKKEDEKVSAGVDLKEINPDDYVTLCDLSALEVTVDSYTFTDEDLDNELKEEFEYYVDTADAYNYTEITDRNTVEEGDLCNIDYEGTKDGVAFDGGTAQGYNLEIGSHSFIDGFEDGLIGKEVGSEVDLDLTFPEDYHSEDLAGAAVVFHVKINKIQTKEMLELNDENVAKLGMDYTNVDDLKKEVKENLEQSCQEEKDTNASDAIWSAVVDGSEVKDAPEALVDYYKEAVSANVESYAQMYGVTVDEFIKTYMGMDVEAYNTQIVESAKQAAKEDLIYKAVAKAGKIKITDDEVKSGAEAEYADYGYESADAFLEDVGEYTYYAYLLETKVKDYLQTVATIKDGQTLNYIEYRDGAAQETADDENVEADDEAVEDIAVEETDAEAVMQEEEAAQETEDAETTPEDAE